MTPDELPILTTKSAAVVEIMGKLQGLLEHISESTGTQTSSRR